MQELHSRSVYALMVLIKKANNTGGKQRNVLVDEVAREICSALVICEKILVNLGYSWSGLEDLVQGIPEEWDDVGQVVNLDFLAASAQAR